MKIAVLAWDSLIWDPQAINIVGGFKLSDLALPIEFCRVSRDGGLTLVIDEGAGDNCLIYAAESAFGDLGDALKNLWQQEGSKDEALPENLRTQGRVGFLEVGSGNCSAQALERHPKTASKIKMWAETNEYDAAIWIGLADYWRQSDKSGIIFRAEGIMKYLEALDEPKLEAALAYIRSAPKEVRTYIRTMVEKKWPNG